MQKHTAIYIRVSSAGQSTRSQKPDLKRWIEAQEPFPVKWYTDKASGRTMDRKRWNVLQSRIEKGKISRLVVWRLDRLGRTASGLTKLFTELQKRKINLISIKDGIDLETTAGRLIANVLASVAQYENEVRSERVLAGQAVARAAGKKWGGKIKGRLHDSTERKVSTIVKMKKEGKKIACIADITGLTRPTVYRILQREGLHKIKSKSERAKEQN